MRIRRSAAIVGALALVGAWFASAAGLIDGDDPPVQVRPRAAATSGGATLLDDVKAQSARLRSRLSRAPSPQPSGRNPFRFQPRRATVERSAAPRPRVAETPPPAAVPAPLPLKLEGLAERETNGAVTRIAILSIYTTVFFAAEGETVQGMFRVKAIGEDVVEVEELATGRLTQLAIR